MSVMGAYAVVFGVRWGRMKCGYCGGPLAKVGDGVWMCLSCGAVYGG